MRLDKYLIAKHPNLSRVYIKNQVKLGNFLVNGKRVKPSQLLSEDDEISFALGFSLPEKAVILPNPNIKLNIIFENNDVIVIDKPADLSVHPRQDKNGLPLLSEINNTLISGLLAYCPAIANVGDSLTSPPASPDASRGGQPSPSKGEGKSPPFEGGEKEGVTPSPVRPGIVHRLDKDTSGLMIVAKNQNSFDWLKKQFKDRQITKKYLALVSGRLAEKEGQIKTLLQRASSDPTRQKVQPWTQSTQFFRQPESYQVQVQGGTPHRRPLATEHEIRPSGAGVSAKEGKEAITNYKVIKEFKNYSLLEVSPKTGRLHQIRVHLAHLGHPVAGDAKYGPAKLALSHAQRGGEDARSSSGIHFSRQFLHATELDITLPDGQKHVFSALLPPDLANTLATLEKISN